MTRRAQANYVAIAHGPDVCRSITRVQAGIAQAHGEQLHIKELTGATCQKATELAFKLLVRYLTGPSRRRIIRP